uniref:Uncharacterized protein n=1 Tax=viral metagenome TaxID=1070528 RepID=A0A6M3KTU5_9ZZZZ
MQDYAITLKVRNDIACKGRGIGDYLFDYETDSISFELPYPFPCKLLVKSLQEIVVTPTMLYLPSFLKYHNIDFLRQQLMQIRCIENNSVLLHGSAWKKKGVGYLAVGFPNSGKTTRVLREMQEGAEFCSDENVILTKDREIIPVIRKTSLSAYLAKQVNYDLTLSQRIGFIVARLKHTICPIFEPNIWVDLPYERHSFKLDKIIFLNHGMGQSLLTLTDNEFPFITNPILQAYSFATGWDLQGVYNKYKKLVEGIEC